MSSRIGHLMAPSSGAVVSTRAPTSLQLSQGNAAWRVGRYAEAVAEYARLLMQAPELAETLAIADSLALARQRYRRERVTTNAAPRVAVCGWSLGHNPAGRVDTLARLYQSLVEVEIIGCLFPSWGREIWAPIRRTPIPVRSLLVEDECRFIEQALELVLAHPYDLVHLSKPRLPNILIGLLYKWLWEASVLVDIDDEELAFVGAEAPLKLDQWSPEPFGSLIGNTGTRLAVGLADAFDGVTVANAANHSVVRSLLESHGRGHVGPRRLAPELVRFGVVPWFGPLWRALSEVWGQDRGGVSIIILTLNGAALLDRLLRTFVATNSLRPVELIVVDHGALDDPGDETAAVIERYRAVCELWHLRRGANHSFSASCNFGAAWARYPNLLFLNNDIVYSADALPAALAKLAEPEIGCVGVRLDDDPDSLPPGQEAGIQHLGIDFVWTEARGYYQPRQIRQASLERSLESGARSGGGWQPAVTGAFLLCRRRDFRRLGGFSAEYDYGLEDIDFCLRLTRDLGKRAWCLTELGLRHAESSTRRRDRALTNARIERNHRRFKALWGERTRALAAEGGEADGASLNVLFVLPHQFDSNNGYHVQLHAALLLARGADCTVAVPDGLYAASSVSLRVRSYTQVLGEASGAGFRDGRGPDLVHAWTPREIVRRFVEGVRGRWRCPLVVHLEDNEEHLTEVALGRPFAELARLSLAELDRCIPEHRYHPLRGRWFLDRADGLTLVIETLGRFNRYGRPSLVLSAPVDERLFYPRPLNRALRQALAIGDEAGVVVYTGNVHAANRGEVGELYRAVAELNRLGRSTVLVRTGVNGASGALEGLAPAPQVRELGWVEREQVPEILAAADVLVQPGEPGAFNDQRIPSKLPEYFAMGRPVVLARSHLGLEVRAGEEALVVEAANVSEIVRAVRAIGEDRALAERLALGARRFYERRLRVADEALFEFMGALKAA